MGTHAAVVVAAIVLLASAPAHASGHGPVFGAATPTLGRGGWSVDQAWTIRVGDAGDNVERQQMLKTMLSFGVTENLQISGSLPLVMSDGNLPPARMMSLMSSDRDLEGPLSRVSACRWPLDQGAHSRRGERRVLFWLK